MVRHDRFMDVNRPLGSAGRATGEMQQSAVFRIGRADDEVRAGVCHQTMVVERVGNGCRLSVIA